MSEPRDNQHNPSPSEYDGGGRIVLEIPVNDGPTYQKIWQDYQRLCESRTPEKPQKQSGRNSIARRLSSYEWR